MLQRHHKCSEFVIYTSSKRGIRRGRTLSCIMSQLGAHGDSGHISAYRNYGWG